MYKCPSCGYADQFRVEVTVITTLTDDGVFFDAPGDADWDDGSYCYCPRCDYEGIVEDFLVKEIIHAPVQ